MTEHPRARPARAGRVALLAGVAAAMLVGCQPAPTPTPTAQGQVTVVRVVDGDTVDIQRPGSTARERVRLLGIDAPELAHDSVPEACGAQEAKARLAALLPQGSTATLVTDSRAESPDRFGRPLIYLEAAGIDVGIQLVTEGLAEAWIPASAPLPDRWPTYKAAGEAAKSARAGSWGRCGTIGR